MEIKAAKLVYFSPTGTSRSVVQEIARGLQPESVQQYDITRPQERGTLLSASSDELLIVGVPVYMGRVPAIVLDWLQGMRLNGTPTVCVVVYGNRVYEDALLELADIVTACGGISVAGGAFVGEHSFSSPKLPTAHGRPDADDLHQAVAFGKMVREKLKGLTELTPEMAMKMPGEVPYRGKNALWSVDFIAVSDACVHCGECAEVCPAGAIDLINSTLIDTEACITCCACIKRCPVEARSIKAGPVLDARMRLNNLFSEPKQPEVFV